jgi:hypothetical protein
MPAAMTGVWLTTGGTLIVLLLLVGAFLPRPYAEYHPLQDYFHPAGSGKRSANRTSFKGDSPGEGKGQPGAPKADGKAPGEQGGEKGKGDGQRKEPGGKNGKSEGKGEQSGDSKGDQGGDNKGDQGKGDQAKGEAGKGGEKEKGEDGDKGDKSGGSGRRSNPDVAKGLKDMEKGARNGPNQSSPQLGKMQQVLQRVAPVLKWIVFAVLAVVVLVALLRGGLGFLANFTDWAKRLLEAWRRFWANLFGRPQTEATGSGEIDELAPVRKWEKPFSDFANPFDSGEASRIAARELVRYTFAALEAWARERDLGRRDDETAMEFARRLGEEVPALETEANELADLHARAEYAREKLPENTAAVLELFWQQLERVVEAPMSA